MIKEITINKDFIIREDLRDWIFKEDKKGRFRERIIEEIRKFGVMNWFKAKGYPINKKSIWKNRYTGGEEPLENELCDYSMIYDELTNDIEEETPEFKKIFEDKGYYLWENWLPIEIWNYKDLFEEYKEGTSAYQDRMIEEEKSKREFEKKEKANQRKKDKEELNKKQNTLF